MNREKSWFAPNYFVPLHCQKEKRHITDSNTPYFRSFHNPFKQTG